MGVKVGGEDISGGITPYTCLFLLHYSTWFRFAPLALPRLCAGITYIAYTARRYPTLDTVCRLPGIL